ncbi:MAG: Peptidoglycan-binding domain 1 protein [Candidatus Yanofskybacteria bacterium GW2011_GWA1_48_10]|uniref:Peptidoglycan-binding domain 1 protein n=2 Tax=Parcubacteria group TaxID=1794811 RepID=A0A0G1U5M4_9BACT|nr:MAG: Peptidoglycan-binding domain 1 protein [Candidatus Nomurabacteria bacterium GW2011_GWB1_47_6]KKU89359.1 MAG: Peptidoglycan-binding domain 1 protein [Candidatus Yanofskybacteria bacterium GW2011_GWA1_48_10]
MKKIPKSAFGLFIMAALVYAALAYPLPTVAKTRSVSSGEPVSFPSGETTYTITTSKGPITASYKYAPAIKDLILQQQKIGTYLGNKFKSIVWTPDGLGGYSGPVGRFDISDPWNPRDAGIVGLVTGGSGVAGGIQPASHKGPFQGTISESKLRAGDVVFGELANGQGRFAFDFGGASGGTTPPRDLNPVISLAPGQGVSIGQLLENRVAGDASVVSGARTKQLGSAVIDATASGKFFLFSGGATLQIVDLTNLTGDVSYGSATLKPFSSEPWPNITELHIVEVPGVKNHFLVARSGEQYADVTAKPVFYIGEINADTGTLIRQNSFTLGIQGINQSSNFAKVFPGSGLQSASVNGKAYVFMNETLTGASRGSSLTVPGTLKIAAYQFDPLTLTFSRKGDVTLKNAPYLPAENIGTIRFQLAKTENGDAYPMLASWSIYKTAVPYGPHLYSMNLYSLKDMLDSQTPFSITPTSADVVILEEEVTRPLTMGQVEVKHMGFGYSVGGPGPSYNIFLKKEGGKTNFYFYREAFMFDGRSNMSGLGTLYYIYQVGLDAFGDAGHYWTGINGPTTLRVDKIDVSGFTGGTFSTNPTDPTTPYVPTPSSGSCVASLTFDKTSVPYSGSMTETWTVNGADVGQAYGDCGAGIVQISSGPQSYTFNNLTKTMTCRVYGKIAGQEKCSASATVMVGAAPSGGGPGNGGGTDVPLNPDNNAQGTAFQYYYSSEETSPKNDSGSVTLRRGSSGATVSALQTLLNQEINAGLSADGKFGPKTKAAVINYQRANGLVADGLVGPKTKAALGI